MHNFTARSQHHSSRCSLPACRTELLKRVDEPRRHLHEQQVAQQKMWRVRPSERGSPEPLQNLVRSCKLKLIHIIMQALENEEEYL